MSGVRGGVKVARRPWRVLHLFAGAGGCALGFRRAGFELVGAVDSDPLACQAFEYLVGEKAVCADLGAMTPAELRAACRARPDVVVSSPPCKPFSGCLPQAMADSPRYQEMSSLALRGVWLALEAWETPPPIIALENVPRVTTRGATWLHQLSGLLRSYGYAIDMRPHDAGELGGLAQRRKRFLLIARHMKQVPTFVYQPPKRRLKGVGEVLGELPVPLPGSTLGGPMHRLPRLSPMNWVRLALIPAGGDWRDLPPAVAIVAEPNRHRGGYGVGDWTSPSKTVVGATDPRQKPVSLADPRIAGSVHRHNGKYGVEDWNRSAHAVIGEARTGKGWAGVADPRLGDRAARQNGGFGVENWQEPAHAVIAEGSVRNTRASVADPRIRTQQRADSYGVQAWGDPAHAVLARGYHDNAMVSIADPRSECVRREGAIGVTGWAEPSAPVIAAGRIHNGPWQVADPRLDHAPRRGSYGITGWAEATHCVRGEHDVRRATSAVADPRVPEIEGPPIDLASKRPCYLIIQAADGTWHRPMTTLELAVLQGFPWWHRGDWLRFPGNDQQQRQLIGNAIPPPTARAMGGVIAAALDAAAAGRTFSLSSEDIWVTPEERLAL